MSGYQSIGDPPGPGAPASVLAGSVAVDGVGSPAPPVSSGNDTAAAGGRMAAAVDALLSVRPPALAVYTEPLRPSADLSLRDRATLVAHSVRPWGEFFDPSAFAFPAWGEAGLRAVANIETYFYNYVCVGTLCLVAAAAAHVGSALVLAALVAAAMGLYVVAPPVVALPGGLSLGPWAKGALMAVATWFGIAYWHVGLLGGVVACATAAIVCVHALFRSSRG